MRRNAALLPLGRTPASPFCVSSRARALLPLFVPFLLSCARTPKMPDEPAVVMRQIALKEVVSGVNPVDATWIGLADPGEAKIFELERCGELFVGTETGASLSVDTSPERILSPLQTLRAYGPSHVEITPKGPTCVVYIRSNGCERTKALPLEDGGQETVSWANGAMSATFSH